ncbi:hypothetical protein KFK09_028351 [Dendrobium nobile]|uniref:Uncharacterized protein n=1 Tax=Dendrobium nobile TaxID=94219 RepID=A0A8T3A2W2_DENNO|nr:hypothetical protein KFK09_028351 [Dendrobium nobile]
MRSLGTHPDSKSILTSSQLDLNSIEALIKVQFKILISSSIFIPIFSFQTPVQSSIIFQSNFDHIPIQSSIYALIKFSVTLRSNRNPNFKHSIFNQSSRKTRLIFIKQIQSNDIKSSRQIRIQFKV